MRNLPVTRAAILNRREGLFLPLLFASIYLATASSAPATITATGDVEPANPATWTSFTNGYIGNTAAGNLVINAGSSLLSSLGSIGYSTGVAGAVTVDGSGSNWTNFDLYVGDNGIGTLNVSNGGSVSSYNGVIASLPGSTGVMTVSGSGSKWTVGNVINVGQFGAGTLKVTAGGTVTSNSGQYACTIGLQTTGLVLVDGAGSTWTNNGLFAVGGPGAGTLYITGGGAVAGTVAYVSGGSLLAIDVGRGSSLALNIPSLNPPNSISSQGTIRILAGAGVAAPGAYSPISAATWSDSGIDQAVGGVWNTTTHQFTVSNVQTGAAGAQVSIDPGTLQRMLITDSAAHQSVGASFLAAATTGEQINLLATTMSGTPLTTLMGLLAPGQSVLGAWNFAVTGSGYATNDPAYLSFGLGAGYNRNGLAVWHYDGSQWTSYAASDLTYDGNYASFTVTGFSGYAVTTVPEPGTLALLLAAGLGLLWRVRRRR
jgi:T5SS/PEP-CTERM-associated repeat protein